jgi:hypothetical protein
MVSLPGSEWLRALRDAEPAAALVMAVGLAAIGWLAPMDDLTRVVLFVFALVCSVPSLNWLVKQFGAWRRHRLEIKRQPEVQAHLGDLGPHERQVLAGCLRRNEPSFTCHLADPTATSLRHKGLAMLPTWSGDICYHPHVIPDYVWKELRRRSLEILSADDARQRAEAERLAAMRSIYA